MNLLFLTPQLPYPPHSGAALRNWGLISELARRHEITLLTFGDAQPSTVDQRSSGAEPGGGEALERILTGSVAVPHPARASWRRAIQQFSSRPDLAYRLRSAEFDQQLQRLLLRHEFEVVQVEGLELAHALPLIRRCAPRALLVYDAHNVEHRLQQTAFRSDLRQPRRWLPAMYSLLQSLRLKRYEAGVCRQADVVACVSLQDAAVMRNLGAGIQPVMIPNGLRLTDYPFPADDGRPLPVELSSAADGPLLVFTGKMDYRPNWDAVEWFASAILPRIAAVEPQVKLAVVGRGLRPRLASRLDPARVILAGGVPDTRPFIARADVAVMPLRMGGGTRFKLLEALALGAPVVSTRMGAEGFLAAHGQELLLADSPDEFAQAVLRVLGDPDLRRRLRLAARAFVEARYDWAAIVPTLEAAYRS